MLPRFPLVPSAASHLIGCQLPQSLLWGLDCGWVLPLKLPGCPGVLIGESSLRLPAHRGFLTGVLVIKPFSLILLTHPNPKNVLTWLTKTKASTLPAISNSVVFATDALLHLWETVSACANHHVPGSYWYRGVKGHDTGSKKQGLYMLTSEHYLIDHCEISVCANVNRESSITSVT